jgi:hypothetical protein
LHWIFGQQIGIYGSGRMNARVHARGKFFISMASGTMVQINFCGHLVVVFQLDKSLQG